MQENLNLVFKKAKGKVYSLEEIVIEESLGELTLSLEESEESIEASFWLEELLLFSEPFDKDDLADCSSDEIAELFSWKADEINEKVIAWRLTKLRETDLPVIKAELCKRLKEQLNSLSCDSLLVELEDVGWFPNHHALMPEEVEQPYPNLVIEVTGKDIPCLSVCQSICFYDGAENFDFSGLAKGIISQLMEKQDQ